MLLALPIAVLAGLASFFTPCSLPLVPGYLSYAAGMTAPRDRDGVPLDSTATPRWRLVLGTALFVTGFAMVFTSYGLALGSLGSLLIRYQEAVWRISGLITIVMGVLFTGAAGRVPGLRRVLRPGVFPRVGLGGAPVLGAVFAVGWTPCMGPALAAVLTLSTTAATAERGAVLSLGYAAGLGLPFLVASATITSALTVFVGVRRHAHRIAMAGGAMMVLLGVLQVSGIWSGLVADLQGVVAGWQAPL
jgi:cytochrome c-type biogenesis protein